MAFVLAADDECFNFLEVVDRHGADEAVLHLGEQRASADKTEELFVNVTRCDEVDGADAVFECVGIPGMLDVCAGAAGTHGTVVVAGVCMEPDPFMPLVALLKELTVRFAVYYRRHEFAHALGALARGLIDPAPFVTDRVALDHLAQHGRWLAWGRRHRRPG